MSDIIRTCVMVTFMNDVRYNKILCYGHFYEWCQI